jgi:hypothetical protein
MVDNNKKEILEQIYKEKLTTLICILFPFSRGYQKKFKDLFFNSTSQIDKELFIYLKKGILVLDDSKVIDFKGNKIENFTKISPKDLFLDPTPEAKHSIISSYRFLIISRCLRKNDKGDKKKYFDNLLKNEFLISFKIHFILEHQEFYGAISNDFIDVYNGLLFINIFYNEIFCGDNVKKRIMKDDENNKYVFGNKKFVLSLDNNFDIDILFSEEDNQIYKETLKIIEYFYNIQKYDSNDIDDLIKYSRNKMGKKEFNFIFNIVEHVYEKREYIHKNINNYRNSLIQLEKKIYSKGIEALKIRENQIYNYKFDKSKKDAFDSLLNKLTLIMKKMMQ